MEQAKRSGEYIADDNKRQKLEETTVSIDRSSITHFEDLSNELIYEIFESSNFYDIYLAFSNLNQRFQDLLHSKFPINIDISSITKSNYQYYYREMIILFQTRIRSIRITYLFIYKDTFSPFSIPTVLPQLETLILHNIEAKYLHHLLRFMQDFPKLSSLDIAPIDQIPNPADIFAQLFRLSVLKYCRISFSSKRNTYSLPQTTIRSSSIEHLVIQHRIDFDQLDQLLFFVPHLRSLSCWNISQVKIERPRLRSIIVDQLTSLSLKIRNTKFDQFQRWMTNLIHQIEVLHITTKSEMSYVDAHQWEELIRSSLPSLRIFDVQHSYAVHQTAQNSVVDSQIEQFNSSFWLQRQWVFQNVHGWKKNWDNRLFYSTNPYRRKSYTIYGESGPFNEQIHLNTVDHVHIQSLRAISNYINYFPSATKLTLEYICDFSHQSISTSLNNILPLSRLTKLVVDCPQFSFVHIVELLHSMPNLRTIKLESITDHSSIEQTEHFRLVSNSSLITSVTIEEECILEKVQLMVTLCRRMEHLTVRLSNHSFKPIVKFLLSKTNEYTRHLFSLCLMNATRSSVESLETLIQSDELFDDYSYKLIDRKLYVWW